MEMEFMAEFTEGMSRDRSRRQTIRGKRTKRQRPCSPFGLSTSSSNSTAEGDCLIDIFAPDESPVMSSEMSTEEEEDMANCLIMLAKSDSPVKEEKADQIRQKTVKLSNRRFTEMTSTIAAGKSGAYVYECKTCNRTFPSFQALGGHRASHKKPKLSVEEKKPGLFNVTPPIMEYSEEHAHKFVVENEENKSCKIISNNVRKSPSPSSGLIQTGIIGNNHIKGKVHECSICGSEFLSGQALGGHMRKHRPTPPSINRSDLSTNTDDNIADHITGKSPAGSNSRLSLDLNLPPPEAVEDVRSKFQFTENSSPLHGVFSAPALVDCHY